MIFNKLFLFFTLVVCQFTFNLFFFQVFQELIFSSPFPLLILFNTSHL